MGRLKGLVQLALCLMVAATSGCGSIDKTMASWMGHHQSELIASWGPPHQTMDDGQGGKIFIYTATRSYTSPGTATTTVSGTAIGSGNVVRGTATGYTTYNPPTTTSYNAYRMFWIDPGGRVYRWSWRGL